MENRIRDLRIEKNITQVRLSIELGVTQETVSAYETGKHLPSVNSLLKLSTIFNASLDYIMGLSNVRKPLTLSNLNNNELELLLMYQNLDSSKKAIAVAFLSGLSEG